MRLNFAVRRTCEIARTMCNQSVVCCVPEEYLLRQTGKTAARGAAAPADFPEKSTVHAAEFPEEIFIQSVQASTRVPVPVCLSVIQSDDTN